MVGLVGLQEIVEAKTYLEPWKTHWIDLLIRIDLC